ncbi:MAG: hypothetical protein LH472_02585 [Pyrinomonadaceae bacterium]|nr:hypothetical protein [Pyrinomonadaceae bacterium]
MSNLSDIGFPVQSEQDVNVLITETIKFVESIKCPQGFYLRFADVSGAEIYLQGDNEQALIGFNPHFAGMSRRTVGLTAAIERDSSQLDGGFHAWANPCGEDVEISGEYPFVFDVPDFRLNEITSFPQICEIQLTAFASNDFEIFVDEKEYDDNQDDELKYASKSFIPVGLFALGATSEEIDLSVVRPVGKFAGEIKKFEVKTNELSGEKFYWFLVETLGGEVDVVADAKLVTIQPGIGGIVSGQFWLSGKLLN